MRASIIEQRQVTTQDTYGQRTETWNTHITTRGSVEPLQGREAALQSGERADITTRIRLRYASGSTVLPSDRVSTGGEIYNIRSIIPDPKSRELLLMCEHDAA